MGSVLNEEVFYQIYAIVEEIPEGSVATYGQIAKLMGKEKNARLVGKALKMASILWGFSLSSSGKLSRTNAS